MSYKVKIGGNRLGSGNKMNVELSNIGSSNHDLSFIWRNTQSCGTLVPFLSMVGLPGDKFDISLNADVKTSPTLGPLFGSFKLQLDVFSVPMRLYNAKLHNNPTDVGLKMDTIKFPLIKFECPNYHLNEHVYDLKNYQISPSSLFAYLGLRSFGHHKTKQSFTRSFNALPYFAYFDIFKNYYANKMEKYAYIIHNTSEYLRGGIYQYSIGAINFVTASPEFTHIVTPNSNNVLDIRNNALVIRGKGILDNYIQITYKLKNRLDDTLTSSVTKKITDIPQRFPPMHIFNNPNYDEHVYRFDIDWNYDMIISKIECLISEQTQRVNLTAFELKQIDILRDNLMAHTLSTPYILDGSKSFAPFSFPLHPLTIGNKKRYAFQYSQEGLLVKTYQSDIFNNWLKEEFITGAGSIEELTKIDTSQGFITIDTINLSEKLYRMLQRVVVSGGTYQDWLTNVYDHKVTLNTEVPRFEGGMSQEVMFQEVVSSAESGSNPLGSLAGRGTNVGNRKGGNMIIHVHEPSLIMGIVSLTPRIDYSDGNDWFLNLKNYDQLHKPQLDEIGYQDLLTESFCAISTEVDDNGVETFKSIGKQPAWLHYMTNFNKCFGNFSLQDNQKFMTLNRCYDVQQFTDGSIDVTDATTYIDPRKYNYIFADTSLDSMNFWIQIDCNIFARRKMSAKIIPNL